MLDWFASVPATAFTALTEMSFVQLYLRAYGFLALTHLLVQYTFALLHNRRVAVNQRSEGRHRRDRSGEVPKVIAVWVPIFQEKEKWLEDCLANLEKAAAYFEGRVKGGRVTVLVRDDGSYQKLIEKYSKGQPELSWGAKLWYLIRRKQPEDYAERYLHYKKRYRDYIDLLCQYRGVFDIPQLVDTPTGVRLEASNAGKRHVQYAAWLRCNELAEQRGEDFDLYVTVDSDTALDEDAIYQLAQNFADPSVGAATGYVDVGNWNHTWLTRLIDMRYWSAFHVERAAQSYWNCVMCCSGPLAAYRASVANRLMTRYVTQMFRRKVCTFGDDRHFTNLILRGGWRVVMDPLAHCLTDVPERVPDYIPQQKRWSMSFYREMLWSVDALKTQSGYLSYDLFMQFMLPFLLLGGLFINGYLAVTGDAWATIGEYFLYVFGIGLLRSFYPFFFRKPGKGQEDQFGWGRRFSQLLFMGYGVIHVLILVPLRMYALFSLLKGTTAWGTRTS
jgi:cellulose synthase/poly-beta-1,6-N-acetylglucosamine synthase-like glycosyltransferase